MWAQFIIGNQLSLNQFSRICSWRAS